MFSRREFLEFSMGLLLDLCIGKEVYGSAMAYRESSRKHPKRPGEAGRSVTIVLDEEPELMLHADIGDFNYPVVAGKKGHPTPKGDFSVLRKVRHPSWCPDPERRWVQNTKWYMQYYNETGKRCVPYDHPRNPLGSWKIVFDANGYEIHGRGDYALDKGIRYASHGCIRMRNHDIEEIAPHLEIGTPITIY